MLQNTFMHIAGVGPKKEQGIWAAGIRNWAMLSDGSSLNMSVAKRVQMVEAVHESMHHLKADNVHYFASRLPVGQHWRLFGAFRNQTAYLDIETTGLEEDSTISTIALYDGSAMKTYVKGKNLDDFADDIRRYKLLVTFNGKCFDLPVIERVLGCRLDQAHIDLRYALAALGYRGGLKRCEVQLGMDRGALQDIDGLFAVVLWQAYLQYRDEQALETLLAYNLQDVLNLEALMVTTFNRSVERCGFGREALLPLPPVPRNPFSAHRSVIEKYRSTVLRLRALEQQW